MSMKKMLSAYDDLNNPVNIRSHYKTKEEFCWWLEGRTIDQLLVLLIDFQTVEFYEDCAVILAMIRTKKKQKRK